MIHEQVSVRVNATVDRGIAPLVDALNSFPEVFTTSSCEGWEDQSAHVAFDIGGEDWEELSRFVQRLSQTIGESEQASDIPYSLSIEWYAGGASPSAYIRVPRQHVTSMAHAVRSAGSKIRERQDVVP